MLHIVGGWRKCKQPGLLLTDAKINAPTSKDSWSTQAQFNPQICVEERYQWNLNVMDQQVHNNLYNEFYTNPTRTCTLLYYKQTKTLSYFIQITYLYLRFMIGMTWFLWSQLSRLHSTQLYYWIWTLRIAPLKGQNVNGHVVWKYIYCWSASFLYIVFIKSLHW